MIRKGPRFTEAARAAAAQKRRERAAMKAEIKNNLEVFVLRSEVEPHLYDWEIRQFGGVVVKRSERSVTSSAQARIDGMLVLSSLPVGQDETSPQQPSLQLVENGEAGCGSYG